MWGKDLLKKGLRRCIGDGSKVLIYSDCWVSGSSSSQILSPNFLLDHTMVSHLITTTGSWNETLIRSSFLSQEVDAVVHIPFLGRQALDTLIWGHKPNEKYTVNSGYWM